MAILFQLLQVGFDLQRGNPLYFWPVTIYVSRNRPGISHAAPDPAKYLAFASQAVVKIALEKFNWLLNNWTVPGQNGDRL